jgi:PhnB protein
MAVNPRPDGYHTVTPYLVAADVAGLIDFLKAAFDAQEVMRLPGPEGRIGHAEVRIGDSAVMLGGAHGHHQPMQAMLLLYLPDPDAVYHRALAAGAISVQAPADQFYGDRNAGVRDPSGNLWWVAARIEDVPPDELQRRAEQAMR